MRVAATSTNGGMSASTTWRRMARSRRWYLVRQNVAHCFRALKRPVAGHSGRILIQSLRHLADVYHTFRDRIHQEGVLVPVWASSVDVLEYQTG